MKTKTRIIALVLVICTLALTSCSGGASKTFYDLKKFDDFKGDFMYVYSPICKAFGEFRQAEDGLVSYKNDELIQNSAEGVDIPDYFPVNPDEFAYISMVTQKKYSEGTKATLHCSFDKLGSPLIVFTDDIKDEGEHKIYGQHFEVVAYNEGCNVWDIKRSAEDKEWPIDPTLLAEPKFEIKDGEPVEIIVEFLKGEIKYTVNGHSGSVKIDNMPESYHIGFTSCEGIDHFYDFTIESPAK